MRQNKKKSSIHNAVNQLLKKHCICKTDLFATGVLTPDRWRDIRNDKDIRMSTLIPIIETLAEVSDSREAYLCDLDFLFGNLGKNLKNERPKNDRFSTDFTSQEPTRKVSLTALSTEIYPMKEPNSAYQKLRREMRKLDPDELTGRGYVKGHPIPPAAALYIRKCLENL